jgi:hypothetical protein
MRMKSFLVATIFVSAFTGAAFAQGGNIHGTESRGEPVNSSYRASGVDARTGMTPGARAAHAKAYVKKKKRHIVREPVR